MDPFENLREQISIAHKIEHIGDSIGDEMLTFEAFEIAENALRLIELVLALDEWRRKGGFDPYTNQEPKQ